MVSVRRALTDRKFHNTFLTNFRRWCKGAGLIWGTLFIEKNFFPIQVQILHYIEFPYVFFIHFFTIHIFKRIFDYVEFHIHLSFFSKYARYSFIFSILLKVLHNFKDNFPSNKSFWRCNILPYNYLYFQQLSELTIYIALNYCFTILV